MQVESALIEAIDSTIQACVRIAPAYRRTPLARARIDACSDLCGQGFVFENRYLLGACTRHDNN